MLLPTLQKAASVAIVLLASMRLRSIRNTPRSTYDHLAAAQEHFNSDLDYFEPAHSYSPAHAPFKAYERCYVFIGGFGDPPSCYSPLVDRITKARSNSIALSPATQGWDCFDNFKSARTLSYKTWLRGCLSNLKLANTLSERVIVIGHSTGATVISKVLELNNDLVDEVYFTGPNLKANKDDAKAKRLLLSRLGPLIKFVLPVIKKKVRKSEDGTFRPCDTLSREYHKTGYYLKAFPVNSIIEMFKLQEQLGKNTWGERVKRVVFFKGEEDRSVGDVEEQIELVESVWNGKVEHFKIKDAAHNIVWEKEGSGALDLLVNVIN